MLSLDDAEIEESKRDLITREIGKFREVMKVMIFLQRIIINDKTKKLDQSSSSGRMGNASESFVVIDMSTDASREE